MLIDKGTVISPAFGAELLDIHGCYEKGKQFLGALGGEIQQIYFVINAIVTKFAKTSDLAEYFARVAEDPKQESLKHAKTPRELLLENFFLPFMLTFLKELCAVQKYFQMRLFSCGNGRYELLSTLC